MHIYRKSHLMNYGVAILSVATALVLSVFREPIIGYDAPFLFFFSALAFAAWYGGFASGIVATLLGAIIVARLYLPLFGPTGNVQISHILHICVFIATGIFISILMKELHDAIERSSKAEHELGERVQERTAELAQANRELQVERNKLLGILDRMQEAVYIVSPQYEIEYANPAMEKAFGRLERQKCFEYLNGSEAGICPGCWIPASSDEKCFSKEWVSSKSNRVYDRFEAPIAGQNGTRNKLMILHDITALKRTEAELSRKHREIQRLSSELLTAQEAERMRVSRELHDELGQALTLIKLKIGLVDMNLTEKQLPLKAYCEDASEQVDQAIENMRRLSRDLSPVTIETLGITIALRRLVEDFDNVSTIQIAADIEDIDQLLPPQHDILLYRVLQEGLNNIVKHSEANTASISIRRNGGRIQFELKDDGKGINLEESTLKKEPETGGLGITIMRERVRTFGGSLEILSSRDGGTQLCFEIPIRNGEIDNGRL